MFQVFMCNTIRLLALYIVITCAFLAGCAQPVVFLPGRPEPLLPSLRLSPPMVRYGPLHPGNGEPIEFTITHSGGRRLNGFFAGITSVDLFLYEYQVRRIPFGLSIEAVQRTGPRTKWGLQKTWSFDPPGNFGIPIKVTYALPEGFPANSYVMLIARVTDNSGGVASESLGLAAGDWPFPHLPVPLLHTGPLHCRISLGFAAADSQCKNLPDYILRDPKPCSFTAQDYTECTPEPCNCLQGYSGYASPRDMLTDKDLEDLIFEGYRSSAGVALGRRYWQFFYMSGPNAMPNVVRRCDAGQWAPTIDPNAVMYASTLLRSVGIIHKHEFEDSALGNNIFSTEPKNKGTAVHESAHAVFNLSDERPESNVREETHDPPWPHHNVYQFEDLCQAYNDDPENGFGRCEPFDTNLQGQWWSSEKQGTCIMWDDGNETMPPFGHTCLRRIAWYYDTQLPHTTECNIEPLDPNNSIPNRITLFKLRPILFVRLEAMPSGYSLIESVETIGMPLSSSDMGGDVFLTARDDRGQIVLRSSIRNPRVRNVKPKSSDRRTPERVEFAVALPNPDRIRSIEVEVARGPNAPFARTFVIPRPKSGAENPKR